MNRLRVGVLVCLLLIVSAGTVQAEDTDKIPTAWGGVGATFGPCGMSLPAGLFVIGGNVVFGKSENVRISNKSLNDDTKATKLNELFKTRYGIIDGLDIRTATPFYNIHLNNGNAANREVYGVGDTTVLLHKRLLNQKDGDLLSVGFDIGGIVPTGSVGGHSSNFAGNSAWGFMTGIGGTYFYGANRFDIELNYATFTEGGNNYEKGDRARCNFAYAYALSNHLDLGLESQWEWNAQSQYMGDNQHNASNEWYVGPKIVFKNLPWKMNLGLVAKFPVLRWYESRKVASDDFRVELQLFKIFNLGTLF